MSQLSTARLAQQEARERQRQHWLERAGKELQVAEAWDANKRPDGLAKRLEAMVEASKKADILTQDDKAAIRDRARTITLRAHEKYLDSLLERAMAATRDRQRQDEKAALLKEINEMVSAVSRLGTTQAIKNSVKERLDIIRQTSAAGDSTKAKEAAEREAKRKEASHQNEHRTFTRWRDPPLTVLIEGKSYVTVDWSLGGMLVADITDHGWQPGHQLDIKVGLEGKKMYAERIEVVRYLAEGNRLAIKVRRFASVLMQIKRDCEMAGLEPAV
jgi:hypothetical protein